MLVLTRRKGEGTIVGNMKFSPSEIGSGYVRIKLSFFDKTRTMQIREGETVDIGEYVRIKLICARGSQVKFGIEAEINGRPIEITREELLF